MKQHERHVGQHINKISEDNKKVFQKIISNLIMDFEATNNV